MESANIYANINADAPWDSLSMTHSFSQRNSVLLSHQEAIQRKAQNAVQFTNRAATAFICHAVRKRDKAVRDLEQEQCSRHPFDERRRIERGSHQTATGVGGHRDMQAMETVCWKKDKRKAPNRGSVRVQPVYGWRLWSFLPVPCYTTSLHRHNPILCGRSLRANQVSHGVEVKGRECSGRPFSPSRSVPHSRLRPKR